MAINILGAGNRTSANPSTTLTLTSGQGYVIPSGQYQLVPGLYTSIQWFDPITLMWRSLATPVQSDTTIVSSDGTNTRLYNATGTMVGAVITNAGSGYTNGIYPPNFQLGTAVAPSVTMSAAGGTLVAKPTLIVGGSINTTVVITNGGANYTIPPTLVFSAPPQGGVPATATATLTAGVITGVTVVNQGAGYVTAPTITVVPASGDVTGTGAILTVNATLVGSGTVTAITIQGNVPFGTPTVGQNGVFPITSLTGGSGGAGMTSVPTFTFLPASTTAATAVMCLTVTTAIAQTGFSNSTGNIGFLGSAVTAGAATLLNPAISTGLFTPRVGYTAWSTTATGGLVLVDGGLHQTVVAGIAYASIGSAASGATTAVAQTMGGANDYALLQQI